MRRTLFALSAVFFLFVTGLHCAYADPQATTACPTQAAWDRHAPASPEPSVEIVDESMRSLPTFTHNGRAYVLGDLGQRYWIRIVNPTPARVEAVISVDGLDAVDGRPASFAKRGYIVPAFGDMTIDGWRTSLDTVAAFRFSSVPDSYAKRTDHERNVGVVGAAFFDERARPGAIPSRMLTPPSAAPWPSRAAPQDTAEASGPTGAAAAPTSHGSTHQSAVKGEGGSAARKGLGTEFGESQSSSVVETRFVRADPRPAVITELRYDDRDGLLARGIRIFPEPAPPNAENELRDTADPFPASRFAEAPR
jgi:hypothetical protein